jgi:hypothetical protein
LGKKTERWREQEKIIIYLEGIITYVGLFPLSDKKIKPVPARINALTHPGTGFK